MLKKIIMSKLNSTKINNQHFNYCCTISQQLDLTFQQEQVHSSYQISNVFIKLATDLLEKISICPLCTNFLTNLKGYFRNQQKITAAKRLLTHQDLVEEMVTRIEQGAIPATEEFWRQLLYLYSQRDWEVCFSDERGGYKGFAVPDQYFYVRDKEQVLSQLKKLEEDVEQRTPI